MTPQQIEDIRRENKNATLKTQQKWTRELLSEVTRLREEIKKHKDVPGVVMAEGTAPPPQMPLTTTTHRELRNAWVAWKILEAYFFPKAFDDLRLCFGFGASFKSVPIGGGTCSQLTPENIICSAKTLASMLPMEKPTELNALLGNVLDETRIDSIELCEELDEAGAVLRTNTARIAELSRRFGKHAAVCTKCGYYVDAQDANKEAKTRIAELESQLATSETLVATLQEQRYAWEEQQQRIAEMDAENTRLRKAIDDAVNLHESPDEAFYILRDVLNNNYKDRNAEKEKK